MLGVDFERGADGTSQRLVRMLKSENFWDRFYPIETNIPVKGPWVINLMMEIENLLQDGGGRGVQKVSG